MFCETIIRFDVDGIHHSDTGHEGKLSVMDIRQCSAAVLTEVRSAAPRTYTVCPPPTEMKASRAMRTLTHDYLGIRSQ